MRYPQDIRDELVREQRDQSPFSLLRDIATWVNVEESTGRELVVRALEKRSCIFSECEEALDALAMHVGLYPYVTNFSQKSLRTLIEHAAHGADGELSTYTLHRSQSDIFEKLIDGKSVILSAPTSYGKSLLIDAVIAAKSFLNVVIIVPTIALIEETRRRMMRFSNRYSLITNSDQQPSEKNIFVLTQERYMSVRENVPTPEFFVIDEFYKLSNRNGGSRSTILNRVFFDLYSSGSQFYLLGPSIREISSTIEETLNCEFIIEDFHTVALDLVTVAKTPSKLAAATDLLASIDDQTLVYCKSPKSARKLMNSLI